MKDLVIGCENLRDEVEYICNKHNIKEKYDFIWMDSKYHNTPEILNRNLQDIINENMNYFRIILLYGQCGNSTLNLQSKYSNLILPKVSDCISLYLGSNEKRKNIAYSDNTYFFTKRYIEDKNSLYMEFCKLIKKYGQKKAIKMYKKMMDQYNYIKIIDTGTYDVNTVIPKVQTLCDNLGLEYSIIDADLSILEKLIKGEFDDNFIVKSSENKIKFGDFE